ncbi:hypothetical protein [Nocardioides antri]|uniref:Calcium-binding protein n=1 Tax=Nocardioides antri TaxID=2607659 RepID=A0A5B1M2C9_9ACTN|nr:hypothetical protein [Nocardioides antri]KAA1425917.1 hypothetical protein F0U47_16375 [Nocardioides antri]
MKATLSAALVLAALTVLPQPVEAHAPGQPTCRGEVATHVGISGEELTTTPGPDVVVTNGASVVRTLNGADVICVTRLRPAYVVPGGGDDLVDATRFRGDRLATVLGETGVEGSSGDDRFLGGPQVDRVYVRSGVAADRKLVRTDGGKDYVKVDRQYPGDVVAELGKEGDTLSADRPRAGLVVDGDEGPDELTTTCRGCSTASFDLETGTIAIDGKASGEATGFQVLDVVRAGTHVVPAVTVRGGNDANHVSVAACRSSLLGRGGNDRLQAAGSGGCERVRTVAQGGGGDDLMVGTTGNDELYGGLGRDTATGDRGRDLCRAEVEESCER